MVLREEEQLLDVNHCKRPCLVTARHQSRLPCSSDVSANIFWMICFVIFRKCQSRWCSALSRHREKVLGSIHPANLHRIKTMDGWNILSHFALNQNTFIYSAHSNRNAFEILCVWSAKAIHVFTMLMLNALSNLGGKYCKRQTKDDLAAVVLKPFTDSVCHRWDAAICTEDRIMLCTDNAVVLSYFPSWWKWVS